MNYQVIIKNIVARPTAVVPATTNWQDFPALWGGLLDEVWRCLRAGGVNSGCPNIMLYLDDVPNVEVGVELTRPCLLSGRVAASLLPAGRAAVTVHRGSYGGLASAHEAVLDWCAAHGETTTGTRWELYGPHRDDPAEVWVEVSWLLQ